MAIARRLGFGKKIILGDKNLDNANKEIKWSKEKISYVLVLDITPAKATTASLGAPTA